ncbi:hypothetical protein LEP1GSC058_2163 [Leptospira fainei serovar Hurstbridge str. BUT 6]|uniref:Uncharacterized protein n=1 Tax=Leptospira fainei serovar Hurstbridge str. BUT 6 TaxID=1193011 RepID=S3VFE8_9LEPT|nr:hypothetical protein LEP1GSC058_2163 [Leptospira fainei serovar Hurstbridge str. BUT 6]
MRNSYDILPLFQKTIDSPAKIQEIPEPLNLPSNDIRKTAEVSPVFYCLFAK